MQIYDIRLGLKRSFSDLEDDFGFLMNFQNPVMAQLNIHKKPPEPGKAWRLSQQMALPYVYLNVGRGTSLCEVSRSPRKIPSFTGKCCSFEDLIHQWRSSPTHPRKPPIQSTSSSTHMTLENSKSPNSFTCFLHNIARAASSLAQNLLSASRTSRLAFPVL